MYIHIKRASPSCSGNRSRYRTVTLMQPMADTTIDCITDHKGGAHQRPALRSPRLILLEWRVYDSPVPLHLVRSRHHLRTHSTSANPSSTLSSPTYLIDAYCGSILFALTLAPHFTRFAEIECSAASIHFTPHDAESADPRGTEVAAAQTRCRSRCDASRRRVR